MLELGRQHRLPPFSWRFAGPARRGNQCNAGWRMRPSGMQGNSRMPGCRQSCVQACRNGNSKMVKAASPMATNCGSSGRRSSGCRCDRLERHSGNGSAFLAGAPACREHTARRLQLPCMLSPFTFLIPHRVRCRESWLDVSMRHGQDGSALAGPAHAVPGIVRFR